MRKISYVSSRLSKNAKKSFMYIKNTETPHFGKFSNDTLLFIYANRNKAEAREVTKQVVWIILRNRIFHGTIRHIRSGFLSYARTLSALTIPAYALKLTPETKRYFPVEHLGETLLTNIRFKSHATRLIQKLQTVIDNIDNLDTNIVPLLLEICQIHRGLEGFQKAYWESCREAVLLTWKDQLQEKFTAQKYKSWSALVVVMISTMNMGYDMETTDTMQGHKQEQEQNKRSV